MTEAKWCFSRNGGKVVDSRHTKFAFKILSPQRLQVSLGYATGHNMHIEEFVESWKRVLDEFLVYWKMENHQIDSFDFIAYGRT